MNVDEAYGILELSPGSSDEARQTAFELQLDRLESKVAKAPTQALKAKYRESIRILNEANTLLAELRTKDNLPQIRPSFQAEMPPLIPAAVTPVAAATPGPPITKPEPSANQHKDSKKIILIAAVALGGLVVLGLGLVLIITMISGAMRKPEPALATATPTPTPEVVAEEPVADPAPTIGESASSQEPAPAPSSGKSPIQTRGERYLERLKGRWEMDSQTQDGDVHLMNNFRSGNAWTAKMSYRRSGSARVYVEISGTWELDNGLLTCRVDESSSPQTIPVGYSSVDRIVKLDFNTLVLVSDSESEMTVLKRPQKD